MEQKDNPPATDSTEIKQDSAADALSKPPDGSDAETAGASPDEQPAAADAKPAKKPNAFKAFFKKINVYLMGFLLIVAIVGATAVVSFLNSKKVPKAPSIASQQLNADSLKQLANSDTTVGSAAQTLTVQGNAIIAGQLLVQKDLDVAGRLRVGGEFQTSTLTVANKANLADTQINSLQVANNTVLQGLTTAKDLNVAGTSSFSGPVTVSQITATKLIMSGNAVLQVPNHLAFTGAPPFRSSIDTAVLGAGGTLNINGSDTSGTININTGNNPAAGCFARITFAQAFPGMPRIIVSPFGAAAGRLEYYVVKSQTNFSICTNTPASSNQVFGFDYFIAG